jgi:hypothetical protein
MVDLGFVGPSRPANDYRFVEVTDGDTPKIEMSIRMVSIDTPESEFGGNPPTAQAALERTKARLQDGTYNELPEELRVSDRPDHARCLAAAPERWQAGRCTRNGFFGDLGHSDFSTRFLDTLAQPITMFEPP